MSTARRIPAAHGQRRPRLVPKPTCDAWLAVDEALLAELFRFLPRSPRGLQVRSLDFSTFPDVTHLPRGLQCHQLNLARTAIRSLPNDLEVTDSLDLRDCKELTRLPAGLKAGRLDLRGCTALTELPEGLRVGYLNLRGCTALTELPRGLRCGELEAEGARFRSLPDDLRIRHRLNLQDCRELRELPARLHVQILVLRGCTALTTLPPGLNVFDLDIRGCTGLTHWEEPALVHQGRLLAAGCGRLAALPRQLSDLELLDLRDCSNLADLPPGLRVRDWIDVAGTRITSLPDLLRGVSLRWRGVNVDRRIAFHPETLTADEILQERNVERRRVMLERFGFERFLSAAGAQILDEDEDLGGSRELLCVQMPNDEPLVCVSVQCPSTGRRYLLRVPPETRTCQQALAWTAGFDNPDAYRPVQET